MTPRGTEVSEPANPDVPPPRYTESGGWKRLIEDEQEWLARPARWGIEYLPESRRYGKGQLFNHHYYGRMTQWISCAHCRPLVQEAFAEDGIRTPAVLVVPRDNFNVRVSREQFQVWYTAQHPGGPCDAWHCVRIMNIYERGILTAIELENRLIDNLYELADRLDRVGQTHRYYQARKEWERELALEFVGPNPFRPVVFDPVWRNDTVLSLAKHIYESRDFSVMPILADALQDAGCEHVEILTHCRGDGPHVRGCWVVDLVLDKS